MPMIDAYIPEGALTAAAETKLFSELTEILVTLEGFEPTNKLARAATWIFLHRPNVLSAAVPSKLPRYRFHLTVPEGQYTDEICEEIVKQVSAAVARAEGAPVEEVSKRTWVFPLEIDNGRWGSRGQVRDLPDIMNLLVGGEDARKVGEERLARRRRQKAVALLEGVVDAARRG
jgi:phenylpyruvate tautomerase PptA (4-oxalocrotonate tautomerase family)